MKRESALAYSMGLRTIPGKLRSVDQGKFAGVDHELFETFTVVLVN
ncbi:MAG: hypothetical protein M3198_04210 [Actinomycetota bacterium]|nr:hypothetical protein [Actinomycetota bacterium]